MPMYKVFGQSESRGGNLMAVRLREMTAADYDAVMAIWSGSEGLSIREADSKQNIAAYLHRNPGHSFVAVSDGKIVGAVLAGTDGRRGYLQHLAVGQAYRSMGIGQQLIERAVAGLAAAGIAKTHLFVHCDNPDAQRFYERLGWSARDEVRMYSMNSSENLNV